MPSGRVCFDDNFANRLKAIVSTCLTTCDIIYLLELFLIIRKHGDSYLNKNWRNRPTTIDYIPDGIDYIVSIDESGSSNLKQVLKAKRNGKEPADSEKHFTVTACRISIEHFNQARDMMMELKLRYWENALFNYKDGVKRVCFHSREIRNRKDAFDPDVIDYPAFIDDLSKMMQEVPLTLYASHIDKEKHVKQYIYPASPYDLCMTFVLERIVKDIGKDKNCIIVLEARGQKEDKELLDNIKHLLDLGSNFCPAETFSGIKGVYFNPKWSLEANEQKSYWSLELADLCAYPIQKFFVYGTKDKAYETLIPKVSCYPNYWGKGMKNFP